jgi:hypothetical protein
MLSFPVRACVDGSDEQSRRQGDLRKQVQKACLIKLSNKRCRSPSVQIFPPRQEARLSNRGSPFHQKLVFRAEVRLPNSALSSNRGSPCKQRFACRTEVPLEMRKRSFEQRFAFEQRSVHRIEVPLIEAEVSFRTEVPLTIKTAFRAEVPLSDRRFAIEQRFPFDRRFDVLTEVRSQAEAAAGREFPAAPSLYL